MKTIISRRVINIPKGVKVELKGRKVSVTGTRGTLERDFGHLSVDMKLLGKHKPKIVVEMWFGTVKQIASLRTATSHIQNMFTGVQKGFEYKMRFVYAHFPINVTIVDNGSSVEIRNFLGEKEMRRVPMLPGVKVARSESTKDEIILTGNNIESVSQSAASIHQSIDVRSKDIRKFLDGIYVSEKGVLGGK